LSWTAGPIFPAYLNGPSSANGTTCSHSAWSDRIVVPSGQRDDRESVTSMLTGFRVTVVLDVVALGGGLRLGDEVHWQTDGMSLGTCDRMMTSFEGHKYSSWSGLNCNLFPLL
jgi:hypothetical protein